MPYIKQSTRQAYSQFLDELDSITIVTPGELNYLFTKIAKHYIYAKGISYTAINDVVGALEGAKLEFYRKTVSEYEEEKIKENGDV